MADTNVFEHTIDVYQTMTASERRVADYILKHKPDLQQMTISELANVCNVADATLTRFCRKVGYSTFNDFRIAVAKTMHSSASSSEEDDPDVYSEVRANDSIVIKSQKLCHIGCQALHQTLSLIEPRVISEAVDMLFNADNVYCFGQGNSAIVAFDACGRFMSVTPKFHWISDSHMQANIAATLKENDVILYFSFSGATRELLEVEDILKDSPAKLILVTRYSKASGAAAADLVILCGANEAPYQQGSIAAKIGQLFIIDILFNEYCGRDLSSTVTNQQKSINAIRSKLIFTKS